MAVPRTIVTCHGRPLRWIRLGLIFAVFISLLGSAPSAEASDAASVLPDYPVPNGHFYSQASGMGIAQGFAIVDDGGIPFYDEFTRLGGVDVLGYPSSQRFMLGGFITQATQKELLQWHPETGRVAFVNIFDTLSQRGFDPTLAHSRLIPTNGDNGADSQLVWPQVVARHLALLDQNLAIKARYFANPNAMNDYGLPQGVGDFGGVYVIRCERAAFQQWRTGTPFASPGDVTLVNAGDLAKEFGVVPPDAAVPTSAGNVLIAPPGALVRADNTTQVVARAVATAARPSLVRIDVLLAGGSGVASGIVIDQNGDILTNQHVVDGAVAIAVTFANSVALPATVVGADIGDDLAVIRVPAASIGSGVKPATLIGSSKLSAGQLIVGVGFSPYFAITPATRLGVFQQTFNNGIGIIRSDTFILPGDSGGMLLDLAGNVVGVNDEIRFTDQSQQPLIGYSIDSLDAQRIARRLIQASSTFGGS